jgi:hypothetical protein
MLRALKSAQAISDEVTRIIHTNREVREDRADVGASLPQRLQEPDAEGCNWVIEHARNARGYEAVVGAAIAQVRRRWNLRPDFDVCPPGAPRVFSQPSIGHASKKTGIDDGDTVTLRLGDVRVIVTNTETFEANHYRGTIDGFEIHPGNESNGYRIGETVEFWVRQVFAAATP